MTPQSLAAVLGYALLAAVLAVTIYVAYRNYRVLTRSPASPPRATRTPVTHPLRIRPGIYVYADAEATWKALIVGWHENAWQWLERDYLEIYLEGESTTRYQIVQIERRTSDRWFSARCVFAPRTSAAKILADAGLKRA